jgi:hypothetical protein
MATVSYPKKNSCPALTAVDPVDRVHQEAKHLKDADPKDVDPKDVDPKDADPKDAGKMAHRRRTLSDSLNTRWSLMPMETAN